MDMDVPQEFDVLLVAGFNPVPDLQDRLYLEAVAGIGHIAILLRNEVPSVLRKAGVAPHGNRRRASVPGRREQKVPLHCDA